MSSYYNFKKVQVVPNGTEFIDIVLSKINRKVRVFICVLGGEIFCAGGRGFGPLEDGCIHVTAAGCLVKRYTDWPASTYWHLCLVGALHFLLSSLLQNTIPVHIDTNQPTVHHSIIIDSDCYSS